MLYVLGVNLPGNKSVRIGLNAFYGIGNKTSRIICHRLNINPQYRVNELTDLQINLLVKQIKYYTIDMDLKKKIKGNIDKLISIKCYRGLRHSYGLPVRGQRTRSNGRTQRSLSNKFTKTLKVKSLKKSKVKEKKKPIKKNKKK
jgi:small subunit ribosomal protein S13